MIYVIETKNKNTRKKIKTKVNCSCFHEAEQEAAALVDDDISLIDIYRELTMIESLQRKIGSHRRRAENS